MAEHNAHEHLEKIRRRLCLHKVHPIPRKIIVGIVGGVCLVAGIVMIVTPGPALVFLSFGLLLLASEFKWAERWSQKCIKTMHKQREKCRNRKRRRAVQAKP